MLNERKNSGMNINELRVEALRRLIGNLKAKEFADKYDLDASYISQLLNGHRPMGEKAAKTLELKIGLAADALVMPSLSLNVPPGSDLHPGPEFTRPFRRATIRGTAQLGPNGYWEALEATDGWIDVPTADPGAYSLRVKGESMAPAIRNGWVVWCEPNHNLIPGEYVMVRRANGECMVKELLYENHEEVSLMAVNDGYGRLTIPRNEIEQIHYVGGIVPPSKIKY